MGWFQALGVEIVEDFKELDKEDIDALAAKLKKVQAKKFLKHLAGAGNAEGGGGEAVTATAAEVEAASDI